MTSVFDVIAHEDDTQRVASRKALALAHKRVSERFDGFLAHRTASDYNSRLELIKEEFREEVRQACVDVGYTDVDGMTNTLWNERLVHAPSRTSSTATDDGFDKEARRPKLCPYHSEVIDASLAASDPQAGYHAYAQHAWTDKHCKGEEYEGGRCSFKPEMTTTSYWDEKKEKAEERKREREEQVQQQPEDFTTPVVTENEPEPQPGGVEEPLVDGLAEVDTLGSPEGGETEGAGLTQGELMSVAASFQRFAPLSEYDKYFGGKPGAAAKAKASMIEEYGEEKGESVFYATINKKRKQGSVMAARFQVDLQGQRGASTTEEVDAPDEWMARQLAIRQSVAKGNPPMWCVDVKPLEIAPNTLTAAQPMQPPQYPQVTAPVTGVPPQPSPDAQMLPQPQPAQMPPQGQPAQAFNPMMAPPQSLVQQGLQQQMDPRDPAMLNNMASVREAEALEHQKVTDVPESLPAGKEVHRWRPQNLRTINTEGEGSPNPTKRVDPAPSMNEDHATNKQRLEDIGEGVTEHQDASKKTPYQGPKANEHTWPGGSPSAVSREAIN